MSIGIAAITAADRADFLPLWHGYLAFYALDLDDGVTDRTWDRLIDPASPLSGRIACDAGGRALGFALHHHHLSTWVAGEDCYLEDLFVAEDARGQGVGRALIDDLIALGRARGWHRLYWHTDEDNIRARALYDSYIPSDGHIRYRLTL